MSDQQRSWETFIARIKHCGAGEYGSAYFICSKHEHWKFLWAADRIEKLEAELAELQARIQAAIEVYAGMEGFIPETAAEGYCLRIINEMNKALQETNHE